jgi:hypothetical protein
MKIPDLKQFVSGPATASNLGREDAPVARSLPIPDGLGFLSDLANSAWDLRRITTDVRTAETKPNMSKVARHVDRLWDCLEQAGLKIQDHLDQPFDSGQSLDVLAFQPTPGITREIVIETVRPTVYLQDCRLQMGQVIVGTPQIAVEEVKNDTNDN